jgi:UDP-glucose 4-epimerase
MTIDGRAVLVTGGAGFIGSHLVDELVARGCRVRVFDDLSIGREENLAEANAAGEVELMRGDVRDPRAVQAAVEGVEVVMHLAVSCLRVSLYDPWESHDVNAGGTLAVLEAVKDMGLERFVYCSSSEVYGSAQSVPMAEGHPTEPTTVYGASKLAGEWYARAYGETHGLPVVVVRPFNTYGPREHHEGPHGEVIPKMALRALTGSPPLIFGDGRQTRDFTYVKDTVRGIVLAAESDDLVNRTVNIAYGREVSIARIAELIAEACGLDAEPVHTEARPADVRRHYADVTLAREALGWQAEVAIEDGIRRYVDWLTGTHPDAAALLQAEVERNWEAPSPR